METFGGIAVDVPASALSGFDAQLGAELRRWAAAEPGRAPDGFILAWLVTARIRVVGRLRLWDPLVAVLAGIRRRHADHLRDADPFTAAYLDAVLAHHVEDQGGGPIGERHGSAGERHGPAGERHGPAGERHGPAGERHGPAGEQHRLDDESYLALPLLRLVAADRCSNLDPARLCTLLLADLLRHEQFAVDAARPEPGAYAERTGRIAACIAQNDPSLGTAVPAPPGTAAGEWLSLTALPMSTAHDEYLVIRVLQAYEVLFGTMTDLVEQATAAARSGRLEVAAVLARRADRGFERAAMLAGLLAGARPDGADGLARVDGLGGVDLATPFGHRRFERATRELAAGPAGGPLAEAIAALEADRRVWKSAHEATVARLRPTPAPLAGPPAPARPARPPLVDRAALPALAPVGTPITLRAIAPGY